MHILLLSAIKTSFCHDFSTANKKLKIIKQYSQTEVLKVVKISLHLPRMLDLSLEVTNNSNTTTNKRLKLRGSKKSKLKHVSLKWKKLWPTDSLIYIQTISFNSFHSTATVGGHLSDRNLKIYSCGRRLFATEFE